MAVLRHTQKDIGNYEAKLIGPFTSRQLFFLAIGIVPTAIIDYILFMLGFDIYSLFGITFLIMAIPCFFAFGQSLTYGMKPEDFLKDYYKYHILAPQKRIYQTETLDDQLKWEQTVSEEPQDTGAKKDTKKKKNEPVKMIGKMKIYPHKADTEFKEFT